MQTLTKVAELRRVLADARKTYSRIGFVPTMGYLHQGHMSLVRRARASVGKKGQVVVSIYVNPTQFGPGEDLSRYPRDLARDQRLCLDAGVDVVFAPDDAEIYPGKEAGDYTTYDIGDSGPTKVDQRMASKSGRGSPLTVTMRASRSGV